VSGGDPRLQGIEEGNIRAGSVSRVRGRSLEGIEEIEGGGCESADQGRNREEDRKDGSCDAG
jgi:hypothetical protein